MDDLCAKFDQSTTQDLHANVIICVEMASEKHVVPFMFAAMSTLCMTKYIWRDNSSVCVSYVKIVHANLDTHVCIS